MKKKKQQQKTDNRNIQSHYSPATSPIYCVKAHKLFAENTYTDLGEEKNITYSNW